MSLVAEACFVCVQTFGRGVFLWHGNLLTTYYWLLGAHIGKVCFACSALSQPSCAMQLIDRQFAATHPLPMRASWRAQQLLNSPRRPSQQPADRGLLQNVKIDKHAELTDYDLCAPLSTC